MLSRCLRFFEDILPGVQVEDSIPGVLSVLFAFVRSIWEVNFAFRLPKRHRFPTFSTHCPLRSFLKNMWGFQQPSRQNIIYHFESDKY